MKYTRNNLIEGEIYHYSTTWKENTEEWLILWEGTLSSILRLKIKGRSSPIFGKISFSLHGNLREATAEEIAHFKACTKAGKYVEYKYNPQYEIY